MIDRPSKLIARHPVRKAEHQPRSVAAVLQRVFEGQGGGFILVHVATPLEVCEQRDRKGLYAKARAGIIKEFTGISDPYEEPVEPEMAIDTEKLSAEEAAQAIILHLEKAGFIGAR